MVAAARALRKSAAGDIDIETASTDLAGEESHNRHPPPKTPAERREQLCFGAFKSGADDFRWAQRLGRSRHQQTLMRVAQPVNAKEQLDLQRICGVCRKTSPERGGISVAQDAS